MSDNAPIHRALTGAQIFARLRLLTVDTVKSLTSLASSQRSSPVPTGIDVLSASTPAEYAKARKQPNPNNQFNSMFRTR
jgi:hypothetical protein